MPIPVRCSCGQGFQARDELAGRTVKCPKCGQPIAIPSPTPAAPTGGGLHSLFDEIGIAAPTPGPRCPSCNAALNPGAVFCVKCGTNLQTGERLTTQVIDPDADPDAEKFGNRDLDRAARVMKEDKSLQESMQKGLPWWTYLIALLCMMAFITGMLLIPKDYVFIVSGILGMIVGGLVSIASWALILTVAFKESTTQGLLVLLVPFYLLYYVVINWDEVGGLFLLNLAGQGIQSVGYGAMVLGSYLANRPPDYSHLPSPAPPTAIVRAFDDNFAAVKLV